MWHAKGAPAVGTSDVQGVDNQEFVLDFKGYPSLDAVTTAAANIVVGHMTKFVGTFRGGGPDLSRFPGAPEPRMPVSTEVAITVESVIKGDAKVGGQLNVWEIGLAWAPLMKPAVRYLLILSGAQDDGSYYELGGPSNSRFIVSDGDIIRASTLGQSPVGGALINRHLSEVRADLSK
jgi:hypothetical protein